MRLQVSDEDHMLRNKEQYQKNKEKNKRKREEYVYLKLFYSDFLCKLSPHIPIRNIYTYDHNIYYL